jgi:hypothetical protein
VLTIHVPLSEARKPRRIQITNGNQQRALETDADWQELEAQSESSQVEEPALASATS